MKIALFKFVGVMGMAMILICIIGQTSPNKSAQQNQTDVPHTAQTEISLLKHAIAHFKQQAQADFAAVAQKVKHQPSSHVVGTYYGIDVSHYQGDLLSELSKKNRLRFIITKATNGDSEVDPMFYKNWQLVEQSDRIRGAYHFYLSKDNPQQQARHFVNTVGKWHANDIPPIVDIEAAGVSSDTQIKNLQQDLLSFLNYVEVHTKRLPMIYSNYAFAQQWLNNTEFSRYPLWIADYTKAKTPNVPNTWKQKGALIWQHSDSYQLDSDDVDFDVFHGKLSNLTGSSHL